MEIRLLNLNGNRLCFENNLKLIQSQIQFAFSKAWDICQKTFFNKHCPKPRDMCPKLERTIQIKFALHIFQKVNEDFEEKFKENKKSHETMFQQFSNLVGFENLNITACYKR